MGMKVETVDDLEGLIHFIKERNLLRGEDKVFFYDGERAMKLNIHATAVDCIDEAGKAYQEKGMVIEVLNED
jgi:hypothetical protein